MRSAVGSKVVSHVEHKARKCAREVGPLRFIPHDVDLGALRKLISWKSAQYRRTSSVNTFASPWVTELLERILAIRGPDFAGMLATLYAGDHLVAVHMGMRSRDALHWWFPTYDVAFARHSPGLILLLRVAQSTEALGLRAVDLGRGDEPYKWRFTDDSVPLVEGSVVNSSAVRATRGLRSALSAGVDRAVTTRAARSVLTALKQRPAGQRGLSFVRTRLPWL
jgi:CelD/BcsL family acetyltransferase involved in cellulose biosynthesis